MQIAIFDRYIFKKITKNFLIHTPILFMFFVILDISLRRTPLPDTFFSYYSALFSLRMDRFVAISFLLATVRTLLDCSRHFELISLQITGNSIFKITRMILFFAGLLVVANLTNYQFFYPKAYDITDDGKGQAAAIRRMILADQSELFYNASLSSPQQLKDLFLLKSKEEIWHIESLNTYPPYRAQGIDRFSFHEGKIQHESTLLEDKINLSNAEIIPAPKNYQYLPILTLHSLSLRKTEVPMDQSQIFTHLYYKELMSFLPLLIALCMIPIAACYHKVIPALRIYVSSLFIFILFYFMIRINILLAQSEMISPLLMVSLPLMLFGLSFYRLLRV